MLEAALQGLVFAVHLLLIAEENPMRIVPILIPQLQSQLVLAKQKFASAQLIFVKFVWISQIL